MRHALARIVVLTVVLIVVLAIGSPPARAATDTAAGLWHTIDDATGKVRSLVRITENGGTYAGKVEQMMEAGIAAIKKTLEAEAQAA